MGRDCGGKAVKSAKQEEQCSNCVDNTVRSKYNGVVGLEWHRSVLRGRKREGTEVASDQFAQAPSIGESSRRAAFGM